MAPVLGQHTYYIETRDSSGDLVSVYDGGISLNYIRRTMGVGMMLWTVPDGHRVLDDLTDDLFFRVFLGINDNTNYTWYADFIGLYREKQIATDADGNIYHVLYIPHANDIVRRPIVAYPAGTADESQFTSDDIGTIMVAIMQGGVTNSGGVDRVRSADVVSGAASDVAPSVGTTIDYSCAWRPVVDVMMELATLGSAYYDVVWDGTASVTLRVKYYTDQIGDDKTDEVIFDIGLDNVRSAAQRSNRLQEKTVAIVGGQGSGSSRTTSVRTGTNHSSTHSYEVFVDARDKPSGELADLGDARLSELESDTVIDTTAIQSQGWMYKRDYDFGDKVRVRFQGTITDKLINEVSVTFTQDGNLNMTIGMIDV